MLRRDECRVIGHELHEILHAAAPSQCICYWPTIAFARHGMASEHMMIYGLALVWSLFAINGMRR